MQQPSPHHMRTFLDEGGAGSPSKRGQSIVSLRRRERIYQLVIWVLVMWNLGLQYGRAFHGLDLSRTGARHADPSIEAFVAPQNGAEAYGAARVVCSGCTDEGGVLKDGFNGATAYNVTVDAANTTMLTNASSATANATDLLRSGNSNDTTDAFVQPPQELSPPAPSPPPPPPPPPPVRVPKAHESQRQRLDEGATCTSTAKGDSATAACFSFCSAKFARFHCERCKW